MQLVYKSDKIKDPKVNLISNLKETIFWLEATDDIRDCIIKMGGVLYSILDSEICPASELKMVMGYECIEDNNVKDGVYCIYRKDKNIPIKLTPVKTLTEWFANLPLIYKLDLYNSYSGMIIKHLK